MKEETVIYNGQVIPRKHFRTFVYDIDCNQKLVNSYDEFEVSLASGVWFETIERAKVMKAAAEEAILQAKKRRKKPEIEVISENVPRGTSGEICKEFQDETLQEKD